MNSYYEEVKAYVEYCADIQHLIDGTVVEIGVGLDGDCAVMLNETDEMIRFCDGEKTLLEIKKDSVLSEMLNDVFVEIQDL